MQGNRKFRPDAHANPPLRLAVWSGPRNLSTALMRSFGSRADTLVVDEPFYAHYLLATGLDHPGRAEVIGSQANDWREVAASLHAPMPPGITVHYQKHMAHHLLPEMGREWLEGLTHAFLIRDPGDMLRSLDQKLQTIRIEDTGLPQQVEIFERMRLAAGIAPPVIDADDLLDNPPGVLEAFCHRIGLDFDQAMLRWSPGLRSTDGVWAKYWYESVAASTGFSRWERKRTPLPPHLARLETEARELHARLHPYRARA